ncbi:hypothetical protein BSL78_26588 [Apostichopus japonicus]|uniref:Core-binding (CB) domain-containing protein n=1 Tax=Stichopus japonicus TaxID=307972 RepID=A0A2G8JLF1_STIJA|nr:hypothetical protein BSL78_26588 [Apostichopus japonicus]
MNQYGDGIIEQSMTRGHINRLFAEMPSDRGQQPGTVRAYISAYLKFLKWLLLDTKITPVQFPEASNCLSGREKRRKRKAERGEIRGRGTRAAHRQPRYRPNRQRASAVANMMVENQMKARRQRNSEGEDMWAMLVSDHKTVTTYGASTLALNRELFTDLTYYIQEIR